MCDRVITVPPKTQVQVPTATVVLPDVGQAWWLDAPPILPPKSEPPPTPPVVPSSPTDAWWLTTHEPPVSPGIAIAAAPPSVPAPLPETIAPAQASESLPKVLVIEPS